MKKVIIIVVVLLLAAAGYYFYSKSKGGPEGTGGATSGAQSLKELITANVPQKCTFSATDETGSTEGTTYVSGGKVRSDATVTDEGETTVSHMISDGKTNYIWTDGEKNGFKMTVPEEDAEDISAPDSADTPVSNEVDMDQKTDYKCAAWIPDNSVFVPPTNVTFTDFSQMMEPAGSAPSTASQCSYCDNLSGEDKSACLSAFKCN
jgi:hypothetical protein